MPDEMVPSAGQGAHFGRFAFEFLDIVFPKFAQAKLICLADSRSRKHLSYRQEQDSVGVAARSLRGAPDAVADDGKAVGEGREGRLQDSVCHGGCGVDPHSRARC